LAESQRWYRQGLSLWECKIRQMVAGEMVLTVHTHEVSYFSRMSDSKEDDGQALVEIHERGVEKAETVCAVTDGAEWIQRCVDVHRPDAVRILDFAHAQEKITEVGKTIEEQGLLCAFLEHKCEDKRAKRNKSCQTNKKQGAEPKKSKQTQEQLAAQQSKVRLEGWRVRASRGVEKGRGGSGSAGDRAAGDLDASDWPRKAPPRRWPSASITSKNAAP
jgi:hypothetical protein